MKKFFFIFLLLVTVITSAMQPQTMSQCEAFFYTKPDAERMLITIVAGVIHDHGMEVAREVFEWYQKPIIFADDSGPIARAAYFQSDLNNDSRSYSGENDCSSSESEHALNSVQSADEHRECVGEAEEFSLSESVQFYTIARTPERKTLNSCISSDRWKREDDDFILLCRSRDGSLTYHETHMTEHTVVYRVYPKGAWESGLSVTAHQVFPVVRPQAEPIIIQSNS